MELWWPGEGRRSTTRFVLDGHDVFADAADMILAELTGRGATVDTEDPESTRGSHRGRSLGMYLTGRVG